jgi:hypothetical protein
MNKLTIIQSINLSDAHKSTGKTKHYLNNALLPVPSTLQIIKFPNDDGYYLIYLDANNREMTDTYHCTLQAAIDQAKMEFSIELDEWQITADILE